MHSNRVFAGVNIRILHFFYIYNIFVPHWDPRRLEVYSNEIKDSDQDILVSRHKRMFIRDGRVRRRDQNDDDRLASCDDN